MKDRQVMTQGYQITGIVTQNQKSMAKKPAFQWLKSLLYGIMRNKRGGNPMEEYGRKERLEDFDYFLTNYNELFKKYGKTFLVIKGKRVIGSYNSLKSAVDETAKYYPRDSFIVQECNGDESAYTDSFSSCRFAGL